jgi:uncharacterized protein
LQVFFRDCGSHRLSGSYLAASLVILLLTGVEARAVEHTAESRAHASMAQNPPDWGVARAAFHEAATAGSPTAMAYLGWMHETGRGVPVDGEQAADWYRRAARAGAHDYAIKLGWMYLGGHGVEQDRVTACKWANLAAAGGDPAGNELRIALEAQLEPEQIHRARATAVAWALARG